MKKILLTFLVGCMAFAVQAQTYTVKVVQTNGQVATFPMENIKEITIDEVANEQPQPQQPRYVMVAGTKWATGNLQYDKGTWKIAAHQWDYFNPISGSGSDGSLSKNPQAADRVDHFNMGVVGTKALAIDDTHGGSANMSYAGKLFTDQKMQHETTDFENAAYGDLAFWATKGKYRMPTRKEALDLLNDASWQYGFVQGDGMKIYGFLVTNPKNGAPERNTFPAIELKPEVLAEGVFFPHAGFRNDKGLLKNVGYGAYYWVGKVWEDNDDWGCFLSTDGDGIYGDYQGDDGTAGNCIRPIYIGDE